MLLFLLADRVIVSDMGATGILCSRPPLHPDSRSGEALRGPPDLQRHTQARTQADCDWSGRVHSSVDSLCALRRWVSVQRAASVRLCWWEVHQPSTLSPVHIWISWLTVRAASMVEILRSNGYLDRRRADRAAFLDYLEESLKTSDEAERLRAFFATHNVSPRRTRGSYKVILSMHSFWS